MSYYVLSKNTEAEKDFKKSIQICVRDYRSWFMLGRNCYAQGRYEEAIICFDEGKKYGNWICQFYTMKGMANYKMGNIDRAISCLQTAGVFYKDNDNGTGYYNPLFNLGSIYMDLQDWHNAIKSFTEAIELESDSGEIYQNRGICHEKTGQRGKAENDYNRAKELGYKW